MINFEQMQTQSQDPEKKLVLQDSSEETVNDEDTKTPIENFYQQMPQLPTDPTYENLISILNNQDVKNVYKFHYIVKILEKTDVFETDDAWIKNFYSQKK